MVFGSLFSGIGGLGLGLERAGMTCKWQVEIDDYATKVLAKHWPDVWRWRDVRTFPPAFSQGITKCWNVDLICGGFPCQDISYAGKGAGLNGERSGLFYEAIRVIRVLGPRYVLLENVSALLTRGLDAVLGTLASLGYDAEWHCIPAASVGAPHIRDRVFVLANAASGSAQVWSNANQGETKIRGLAGNGAKLADATSQRPFSPALRRVHRKEKSGGTRHVEFERSSQWAVEPDVGRVADGVSSRVDRIRCLGNAVVPQVAEWIGKELMAASLHKA